MTTFDDLYKKVLIDTVGKTDTKDTENRYELFDRGQLDCLLHPENHPPVWRIGDCSCSPSQQANCAGNCLFDAI